MQRNKRVTAPERRVATKKGNRTQGKVDGVSRREARGRNPVPRADRCWSASSARRRGRLAAAHRATAPAANRARSRGGTERSLCDRRPAERRARASGSREGPDRSWSSRRGQDSSSDRSPACRPGSRAALRRSTRRKPEPRRAARWSPGRPGSAGAGTVAWTVLSRGAWRSRYLNSGPLPASTHIRDDKKAVPVAQSRQRFRC